jgi:NADH-quinone oxidoreductase subunit C
MDAASLRLKIGVDWVWRGGAWWFPAPIGQLRGVARKMLAGEARFASIVASPADGGALRLSWHWDVHGTLLSVESILADGGLMPTIADIYPGADWAERETRDYFAVTFEGRQSTLPLMLRDTDAPGILLARLGARS